MENGLAAGSALVLEVDQHSGPVENDRGKSCVEAADGVAGQQVNLVREVVDCGSGLALVLRQGPVLL